MGEAGFEPNKEGIEPRFVLESAVKAGQQRDGREKPGGGEDRVFVDDQDRFAILADGVSLAEKDRKRLGAELAIATVKGYLEVLELVHLSQDQIQTHLESAVTQANKEIFDKKYKPTTLIVLVPLSDSRVAMVSIGDSRVLQIKQEGVGHITLDQTVANVDSVKSRQELLEDQESEAVLTERTGFPLAIFKYALRYSVGAESELDTTLMQFQIIELAEGDTLLACSDGVTTPLTDSELTLAVKGGAESVIDAVVKKRGELEPDHTRYSLDDTSLVVVRGR